MSTRKQLKKTDKIFNIHPETFNRQFIRINTELNLGKVGKYNRFRSHMLRKYHATRLKNDGMNINDINTIQGKGKNIVDESYFFENPKILKKEYIKHLKSLTIIKDSKKEKIKSEEVIRLEIENKKLKQEIKRLKELKIMY